MNINIEAITLAVVVANLCMLILTVFYVRRVCRKLHRQHAENENNTIGCTEAIFQRIEYISRWLKVIAKMINEDRSRLKVHDEKVNELTEIAKQLSGKFLKGNNGA